MKTLSGVVVAAALAGLTAGCVSKSTHEQTARELDATQDKLRQVEQQLKATGADLEKLRGEFADLTTRLNAVTSFEHLIYAQVAAMSQPAERLRALQQYLVLFPTGEHADAAKDLMAQIEAGKPTAETAQTVAVKTLSDIDLATFTRRIRNNESLTFAEWSALLTDISWSQLISLLGGASRTESSSTGATVWVYQRHRVAREDNTTGPLQVLLRDNKVAGIQIGDR